MYVYKFVCVLTCKPPNNQEKTFLPHQVLFFVKKSNLFIVGPHNQTQLKYQCQTMLLK